MKPNTVCANLRFYEINGKVSPKKEEKEREWENIFKKQISASGPFWRLFYFIITPYKLNETALGKVQ